MCVYVLGIMHVSAFRHTIMIGHCPSYVMQCQQLALIAYSSYTPGPVDLKLGKKHWGDL